MEGIKALAEIPAELEDPVLHTAAGAPAVRGSVAGGQFLQYEAGRTATVYDENWIRVRTLPVEQKEFVMPAGWAPASITAGGSTTKPWLEVQFMTEGAPMTVPAGGN